MSIDTKLTRGDLAARLGRAKAGQSDILSCLLWAFENYGKLAPPKPGYHAYDDPETEVVNALLALADEAADYFGYSRKAEPPL